MEQTNKSMLRIMLALLFPFVACWLQWEIWQILDPFVWFLFFPTVFFSSCIGGKYVGLVSTVISTLLVVYFFIPPQLSFSGKHTGNLYSVAVFLLMGVLFSYTHGRLEQAKIQTVEALEAARLAAEQLQEARFDRLLAEQKQTEDHLLLSEERFRSIFNNSPIAIGIGRRDDGRIVEVNDAWLQLSSYERDEVIGRSAAELNLYARAEERNELIRIINESGHIVNREVSLRRKYGDTILVQYSAELIRLGEESFLQVMMTDITERKRAEEALRESEQFNLQIFNNAEEGIVVYGTDLRYRGWNPYMERLSGFPASEVIGKHPLELFPFLKDRGVIERLEKILEGQAFSSTEFPFYSPANGCSGWTSDTCSPLKNASGDIVGVIGMVRDITARKQAEETLQRYKLLSVSSRDIILFIRCDNGLILEANAAAFEAYGYDHEELTAMTIRDLRAPDIQTLTVNQLAEADGRGILFETLHLRKNGSTFPVEVSSQGATIADSRILVSVIRDITARKVVENALQEKNAELERFTYTVSHDLKSPLVTIKTFIGYLEQDLGNADTGRIEQDLDFMRTAADRMEQMLNELLELSRVGRVVNVTQACSFRELAAEARNMVAGRISERGVEVLVGGADVALYGDKLRLVEIWQNLLENACKFMGSQTHPRIEIGAEGCGRETVFFVRDNGVGIEPQYQEKVFGLFEKLDRNVVGTGLGLALVKRIVELNGGKIRVESHGSGQGACFRFTLPWAVNDSDKGETT